MDALYSLVEVATLQVETFEEDAFDVKTQNPLKRGGMMARGGKHTPGKK